MNAYVLSIIITKKHTYHTYLLFGRLATKRESTMGSIFLWILIWIFTRNFPKINYMFGKTTKNWWFNKNTVHTKVSFFGFWKAYSKYEKTTQKIVSERVFFLIGYRIIYIFCWFKGQIISKGLLVSSNSPKNERTNSFLLLRRIHSFVFEISLLK